MVHFRLTPKKEMLPRGTLNVERIDIKILITDGYKDPGQQAGELRSQQDNRHSTSNKKELVGIGSKF